MKRCALPSADPNMSVNSILRAGIAHFDGWVNAIMGYGGTRDKVHQSNFDPTGTLLSETQLQYLYHFDYLAARICHAIVEHALMQGFYVSLGENVDEDAKKQIMAAAREWDIVGKVTLAATMGRAVGGAAILVGVEEGSIREPLDVSRIRPQSLRYLLNIDRTEMTHLLYNEDTASPSFGDPLIWQVTATSESGFHRLVGQEVHDTRLVKFPGAMTSRYMRSFNNGWDLSVLQRPYEVLRDSGTTWKSVNIALQEFSQAVFKVKNLLRQIAGDGGTKFDSRMATLNLSRSMARAVVVDADTEDYQQVGVANLTGLAPILEKQMQREAAAAEMPVTVLQGMSPSGMNATGAADMRGWFNNIRSYQTQVLEPRLRHIVRIIAADLGIVLDQEPDIMWKSLWQMSPTEEAQHRKMVAETDAIYIGNAAVTPEEVGLSRWGTGKFSPDMEEYLADERRTALDDARAGITQSRREPDAPERSPQSDESLDARRAATSAADQSARPPGADGNSGAVPGPPNAGGQPTDS